LDCPKWFQATIYFSYFGAAAATIQDGQVDVLRIAEFAFGVRFYGLIEYVESGANQGYQPLQDQIVGGVSFNKFFLWKPLRYETTTVGGVTVHLFIMETRDGLFRAALSYAGQPINVDTVQLTPQRVKIDVGIRTVTRDGEQIYNWNAPNSRFALATVIVSKAGRLLAAQGTGNSSSVQLQDSTSAVAGSFTWDRTVDHTTVSGQTTRVAVHHTYENSFTDSAVRLDAGFSMSRLFFAYDQVHPERIIWDPDVNVDPGYDATATSQAATGSQTGISSSSTTGLDASSAHVMTPIVSVILAALMLVKLLM